MFVDPPWGLLGWLIVGLIAGGLASAVSRSRSGCIGSTILGVIGAFVGGFLFSLFGFRGWVDGFLGSIFVAFIGALVLASLGRLLFGGSKD